MVSSLLKLIFKKNTFISAVSMLVAVSETGMLEATEMTIFKMCRIKSNIINQVISEAIIAASCAGHLSLVKYYISLWSVFSLDVIHTKRYKFFLSKFISSQLLYLSKNSDVRSIKKFMQNSSLLMILDVMIPPYNVPHTVVI